MYFIYFVKKKHDEPLYYAFSYEYANAVSRAKDLLSRKDLFATVITSNNRKTLAYFTKENNRILENPYPGTYRKIDVYQRIENKLVYLWSTNWYPTLKKARENAAKKLNLPLEAVYAEYDESRNNPPITDDQWRIQEIANANRQEKRIDKMPLFDRKENAIQYLNAMRDVDYYQKYVEYLLRGDLGPGPKFLAEDILSRPRMNHVAGIALLTAVHGFMCPRRYAIQAWKALTKDEQLAVEAATEHMIDLYRKGKL